MVKRVKALNERRDQLKSGIVTQTAKKRASLVRKSETADKMKDTLSSLKVLQQSQLEVIQQKLAQAERETEGRDGEQAARLEGDSHVSFTFWFSISRV